MATVLLMAVSIWGFSVYVSSHSPNNWALPVYLGIVAVIVAVGMVLAWRARGR